MRTGGRVLTLLTVLAAAGVAASAGDETRTGCVMQTEAGWFTFCEPTLCSAIKGAGIDTKIAGHKVTVRGALQAETADAPKTFVVTKIVAVGATCNERCSPRTVHRGIGNHDKPGAEGGTPGAVAPAPKVPPPM